MQYWFRRKASDGSWWSVYVARAGEEPFAGTYERDFGVTDFNARRVYLNASIGTRHFPSTLGHEWYHVEEFAQGVARTSLIVHNVLDAAASIASRLPKTLPPELGDDDD